MPPPKRKGGGLGFGGPWPGPGRPQSRNHMFKFSSEYLPPVESAFAKTPVIASTSQVTGANRTTIQIPAPAGVLGNGDIIVVGLYRESADAVTMPSGFAAKQVVDCTGFMFHEQGLYWRRPVAPVGGTMDFNWVSNTWCEAWAMRITGAVLTGDPFDSVLEWATSNSVGLQNATPDVASITPTGPNRLVIGSFTNWTGGAWTPPGGFVENVDFSGAITLDSQPQSIALPTGLVAANNATASEGRTGLVTAILPNLPNEFEGWGLPL